MRDVYEVLKEKEDNIEQLEKELQALHLVAFLLAEQQDDTQAMPAAPSSAQTDAVPMPQPAQGQPAIHEAAPVKRRSWSWADLLKAKDNAA